MNLFELRSELRRSGKEAKSAFEEVLRRKKKVATSKTIRSLEVVPKLLGFQIISNRSLLYIEKGRRKGAKLPVYKTGGEFKLFPELAAWKKAKNVIISDFALAYGIAKKGIAPTPILSEVKKIVESKTEQRIKIAFKNDVINRSRLDAKNEFKIN